MQTLRQLVAGTDFSQDAQHALELALELAAAACARITLVHVCELDVDGVDDPHLAHCRDALSRAIAAQRDDCVEIAAVLRCGKPWEKLDNVAAEVGASLIVIGRKGAGAAAAASAGLGSVAEHLVRSASRPVLIVAPNFVRLDTEARETNRS